MATNFTFLQAFNAMREYLELYYEQTKSDDIGLILSETEILSDGETADSAAWEDWMESIQDILGKHKELTNPWDVMAHAHGNLTYIEGFNVMRRYLELYYGRTRSNDIATILNITRTSSDGQPADSQIWEIWMQCVQKALKHEANETIH